METPYKQSQCVSDIHKQTNQTNDFQNVIFY